MAVSTLRKSKNKQRTSMQGLEASAERKRRDQKRRQRQGKRWASRSGEVVAREMTEEERKSFDSRS
jgi:hypothetical protein